ncbi:sigma-70 family RNA polymerase sigma factor [Phytohabitans rumicis]
MLPREPDVTGLALAARDGDQEALAAFVRATQPRVLRFLAHLVHPRAAEDLTQETYLRAVRSLPGFAARSSAVTWLLAIARRVAADHIHAVRAAPHVVALDARQAAAGRFEDWVILRQLLDALPIDRREAFVATQVAGLTYAEAAQVCDCPIGTIRSRVARAREDLMAALTTAA